MASPILLSNLFRTAAASLALASIPDAMAASASGATSHRPTANPAVVDDSGAPLAAPTAPGDLVVQLWPPRHNHVPIDVGALLGGASITILAITQDEPVESTGDGNTVCDGMGIGGSIAYVRAERRGQGNGRVYKVHFDIEGGEEGGSIGNGVLTVIVPHDRSGKPVIDDGQNYDSGEGCL